MESPLTRVSFFCREQRKGDRKILNEERDRRRTRGRIIKQEIRQQARIEHVRNAIVSDIVQQEFLVTVSFNYCT